MFSTIVDVTNGCWGVFTCTLYFVVVVIIVVVVAPSPRCRPRHSSQLLPLPFLKHQLANAKANRQLLPQPPHSVRKFHPRPAVPHSVIAPPAPPRKVCLSASWRNPCSSDKCNAVFVSCPVEIVRRRRQLGAAGESGGGRQRQRRGERQGDYGPVQSPSMVSVPVGPA